MWHWQFETVHQCLFGIGEAGWTGQSGLSLCTSGELDSMECFIDPSYLVLATQAVPGE